MVKSGVVLFFLLLFLWAAHPCQAQKPAKIVNLSAHQYRSRLETAAHQIAALEKHRPRPLGPILQRFDVQFKIKRADGQTQGVSGNVWSVLKRDLSNSNDATRQEVAKASQIAQSQLRALDQWTAQPLYASADAQKIVAGLSSSGQIRVGPFWWQQAIADTLAWIGKTWDAFMKWLTGLFPTPPPPKYAPAPSDKWLWILFYAVVGAILAAVFWYLFRVFGGQWGSRAVRRAAILEGEDAQLLLLPPTELRSRADEYAAQGNFREALRHRYLALLLQLDARGVWRYDSRRTNWEHIAALRRQENKRILVSPLSELTRRFDRVRYGGAPCDAELWQQFDADARQFESQSSQFEMAGSAR